MKKVKSLKGYVIALANGKGHDVHNVAGRYYVFTKDEWEAGAGCRYEEWECDSLEEAVEWIGGSQA